MNEIFTNFQLPDWLTVSNVISGVTTVILFIVALIRLRAAAKESKAANESVTAILLKLVQDMSDVKAEMSGIKSANEIFNANSQDLLKTADEQVRVSLNLAEFVSTCFSVANLSNDNKVMLKTIYDRLFHKNSELIASLTQGNDELTQELVKAKDELLAAQAVIAEKQAQLDASQRTVKKSRYKP